MSTVAKSKKKSIFSMRPEVSINRRRKNAGATEVETSIVVPSFDVHVMDSQQEKSFLANPKYPAGTNYINPQGQRMTKTKTVQ